MAKRAKLYGTISVDVDIQDVVDELDDEDILELADSIRGNKPDDSERMRESALQAINEIRRGDYADAITTLEREFLPKWQSTQECSSALAKAKAADNG